MGNVARDVSLSVSSADEGRQTSSNATFVAAFGRPTNASRTHDNEVVFVCVKTEAPPTTATREPTWGRPLGHAEAYISRLTTSSASSPTSPNEIATAATAREAGLFGQPIDATDGSQAGTHVLAIITRTVSRRSGVSLSEVADEKATRESTVCHATPAFPVTTSHSAEVPTAAATLRRTHGAGTTKRPPYSPRAPSCSCREEATTGTSHSVARTTTHSTAAGREETTEEAPSGKSAAGRAIACTPKRESGISTLGSHALSSSEEAVFLGLTGSRPLSEANGSIRPSSTVALGCSKAKGGPMHVAGLASHVTSLVARNFGQRRGTDRRTVSYGYRLAAFATSVSVSVYERQAARKALGCAAAEGLRTRPGTASTTLPRGSRTGRDVYMGIGRCTATQAPASKKAKARHIVRNDAEVGLFATPVQAACTVFEINIEGNNKNEIKIRLQ